MPSLNYGTNTRFYNVDARTVHRGVRDMENGIGSNSASERDLRLPLTGEMLLVKISKYL